jgi:hypothetical protein
MKEEKLNEYIIWGAMIDYSWESFRKGKNI